MGVLDRCTLAAMMCLTALGLAGVVASIDLIRTEMRFGLIAWPDDQIFLLLASGLPLILFAGGLAGLARLVSRRDG